MLRALVGAMVSSRQACCTRGRERRWASVGHIAVGMVAGRLWTRGARGGAAATTGRVAEAMVAFSIVSLLPDADVIGFALGIPYAAPLGHRGASHSIVFALACGLVVLVASSIDARALRARAAVYTAVVMLTHGSLDAMTDGGHGIALLWALSYERFFYPWRPIPVSPIGRGLVSMEGAYVVGFELVAFLPLFAWALWPRRGAPPDPAP